MEDRAVYNVREIAKLLNINVPRAYELTKQKDFPAIRIGKRILIPKAAFEDWLRMKAWEKES